MDASSWAATFAGVSTLASIVTAGVAAWSLKGAREDSRDRTRPVVTARLRKGPSMTHGYLYLVITNAGRSVARDINVVFTPALTGMEKDGWDAAGHIRNRYSSPLKMLAPGESLNNIYFRASNDNSGINSANLPDTVTIDITYVDDRKRAYEESFFLDVGVWRDEYTAHPGDASDPVRRQNQALESISWELWGKR